MKIYNITHTSDLDGMASAALLVRQYKLPLKNIFFTNYGGELFDNCMREIKRLSGSGNLLVISDIAITSAIVDGTVEAFTAFKKRGNKIIWLDHHSCDDKGVKKLAKICDLMVVGENVKYCGAELVYKYLCAKEKFCDELTRITHISDFALTPKSKYENQLIIKISMALKSLRDRNPKNPRLRKFVSCLADGNIDCEIIDQTYKQYMKRSRPLLKRLLDSATIIDANGVKIAIGFGRGLSQQEVCMQLMEQKGAPIGVYIETNDKRGSIRSARDARSWGIDITGIVAPFQGGGHPLSAGFPLNSFGEDLTKRKAQQRLVQKIAAVAKKLYRNKIKYYQQDTGKYAMR